MYNQWADSSKIFIDVHDGWSKAPILAVSEKGWMIGTRDFYFEPDKPLTRAQAATLLVRVLELEGGNIISFTGFTDVPANHWANSYIRLAAQHGLMTGRGNQRFAPDEFLTREEMAVLLTRLLKLSPSNGVNNSFKDVDPSGWSYPYISAVAENGIFKGYEDFTFRPKTMISREQMAALLDRIRNMLP